MRQVTSALTIITLLLLSAVFVVDGRRATDTPSVKKSAAHNAKRVRAKLHHLSAAHDSLERHMQMLQKHETPKTPAMKKMVEIQDRQMSLQNANQPNNQKKGPPKPGVTVEQFFEAPHCQPATKYGVLQTRFHDVCARTDFSFVRRHWYDLGRANMAYDNFCKSDCAGAINDLLSFPDGYTCMQSDVLTELRLFSAMCQISGDQKGKNGEDIRCGAAVAASGVFEGTADACMKYSYNQQWCENSKDTRFDKTEIKCHYDRQSRMCTEVVTQATMARECNDCYLKIVGVVSTEFRSICAKRNGKFCLPKVFEFGEVENKFDDKKNRTDAVCADPDLLPCFRALEVGDFNAMISYARSEYIRCGDNAVRMYKNDATMQDQQLAKCADTFQWFMQTVEASNSEYSSYCSRNTTSTDAKPYSYCAPLSDGFGYNGCPATTNFYGCSNLQGMCDADNARYLSELGCCGAFNSYKPETMAKDFPVLEGDVQVKPDHLKSASITGLTRVNVTKLEMCSNGKKASTWKELSDAGCPNPFGKSDEIKFKTVLNFSHFEIASKHQKDQFFFYLKLDIGKAAGVIATAIDIRLEKIAEGGTDVIFTISGDKQIRDDAKKLWEATAATRVLKWTDQFLSRCRECKPLTEASIIASTFEIIPGAPEDACNTDDFFDGYKKMIGACSSGSVDAVFAASVGNMADANKLWNLACQSECLAEFKKLKTGPYKTCVPTEVSTLGDLVNAGCQFDNATKANPNRCGAVLSVMVSADCSQYTDKDNCTKTGNMCGWSTKHEICRDEFTEAHLKPLCDGGCIAKLAATIGMNGDSFGKEAKLLDNMFCAKDEGKLCLPMIQDDVNAIMDGSLTQTKLKEVCGAKSAGGQKLRCMKRIFSAVALDTLQFAEEDFFTCVDTVLDDSTVEHYNKAYQIEYTCVQEGLASILAEVDNTNSMLKNMCSRNKNDDYCMGFVDKYKDDTCLAGMLDENKCTTDCVAKIDTIIDEMGCCTGNLQEVYGYLPFGLLPEEDIPEFQVFEDYGEDVVPDGAPQIERKQIERDTKGPQDASAAGTRGRGALDRPDDFANNFDGNNDAQIDSPKWYFFSNYATCPATRKHKPGQLVYRKCMKRRSTLKKTKTLDLGVSYETVHATEKKSKRFAKKLTGDLAVKVGMAADDFSNNLKKNEKKSINLRGPNRRTTTTSATSSSVEMNSESDTDTQSSSDSYDTHVSDGTLTLTSTSALVKNECSNCTDANADHTSVSTTSTSVSLTTEAAAGSSSSAGGLESSSEGSGVATNSFALATVLAFFAIALF